ncbi:MAG: MltA domain-containing protein [Pseudomonadota bacterium]
MRHTDPLVAKRPHQAPWLGAFADKIAALSKDAPGLSPTQLVEALFEPCRVPSAGFFTGYYEPIIEARRSAEGPFQTPLYRRPAELTRTEPLSHLPGDGTFAKRLADGRLAPMPDRAAIEAGTLSGRGLELAYVADPVDAFFAQVQGSARLRFADGSQVRIGYHGKTGHPYTAIGRVLIDQGVLPEGGATMQTIRDALAADPALVTPTLQANRSFVFFRERESAGPDLGPIAGGGVPLVPLRSLAVDRRFIADGTPLFVETTLPGGAAFRRVMIAEDTGSAIIGPARGDIFFGSGAAAGSEAGDMKAAGRLTVFQPRWPT